MSVILLRTHKFDPHTRAFAEQLAAESGLRVIPLVDETKRTLDVAPFEKISINADALASLGLPNTPDAPWRCGDYGLYVAMRALPDVDQFWLVEYDVRFHTARPLSDFFSAFDSSRADLIAPLLATRDRSWFWHPAMAQQTGEVWGCLFCLLRASRSLLQVAHAARAAQARSPIYRLFWPNDESFLATIAVRLGMERCDLNEVRPCYTPETFTFVSPSSGEKLALEAPDELAYHPVLFGEDYTRKLDRLAQPIRYRERLQRKMRRMLRRFA